MPKFIDYHEKVPPLSPEQVKAAREAIKSGQADPFGVKMINQWAAKGGQAFCLTEAPNPDAVKKSHQAMGSPVPDRIHEVESIA